MNKTEKYCISRRIPMLSFTLKVECWSTVGKIVSEENRLILLNVKGNAKLKLKIKVKQYLRT